MSVRGVSFSVRAEHLYVHVPFCARRCVYCDFSIAVRPRVPVDEFVQAVDREFATRHRESEFELATLYFGGGTPSKLGGEGVQGLIDAVRRHASFSPDAEITLEANPEDVTADAVRGWRRAGVNRVSLGIQSFDEAALQWMHRTHDAEAATNAVHTLRELGIDNISVDLIFALPSSVGRSWERDLDAALCLDLPHLSVYGLTVEAHTPLGRWVARRDVSEAPEEVFEREYMEAHERITASGFEHYEVSNYSKPDKHSRHNWAYWKRKPYGGLGPSAHEFDGCGRRWNTAPYADWVTKLTRSDDPLEGREELAREQTMAEELYLNLRTGTGVAISLQEQHHVARWIESGWATLDSSSTLRLTGLGWLRLDALASDLTILRSR